EEMAEIRRREGLVFDEIKLSLHLDMTASARIEGFVDLAQLPRKLTSTRADHGLVVMFQTFVGRWTQIIGMLATISFTFNAV
ncbi:hypothetical protein HPB47_019999, partial [Ixodes persulcatus]